MNYFFYLSNPLRKNVLPRDTADTVSLATFTYGFQNNADPIGGTLSRKDENTPARNNAIMATYFTPTENFSLWLAWILGAESTINYGARADQALFFEAKVIQWLDAVRAYIRAINPGRADAELFPTDTPISFRKFYWNKTGATNGLSVNDIRNEVARLTNNAPQKPLPLFVPDPVPVPVPVPNPNPNPNPTPQPAPQPVPPTAAETVARWRLVLSDARRLETDASAIGLALRSVLQAWQAAGDYPDQVRTLTGLVQDAAANVDYARQLAGALVTVIQVGETIMATGMGTLPADPRIPPPPALPTVIPAKPDGTTPVVTAITVPTQAKALEKYTADVVKPDKSGVTLAVILVTLLSLFN